MKSKKVNYQFTTVGREKLIERAQQEIFDLIIIGGGVTGCGIALDAAVRGISVLLVEKKDFASGTSSKSTKLIHGGLRYLKQLEIGLVRESGTERAVVHKNAPHLVHPEKMLLPIVENGSFGKITARLAISVYDYLADVTPKDKKVNYNKEETLAAEPLLNAEIVKGGILYSEYRTDDARLTIELMKTAIRKGAMAFNHCEMLELSYFDGQVNGIICLDHLTGEKISLQSKFVVSAAGPWVDKIRAKDNSLYGKSLHLTKGVHIVVEHKSFPVQHATYFDVFDGRMIFAIPRGKVTYIGTSDTEYNKNLDRVICTREDVNYLIEAVNRVFPSIKMNAQDVVSTWAGLRPLIHEDGKSASELSRKDEIFESDHGLISIAGGKLTGYRKMAKRIVDLITQKDDSLSQKKGKTKKVKLTKHSYEDYDEVLREIEKLAKEILPHGLTEYHAWYLITTYGPESRKIIDHFYKQSNQFKDQEEALIRSELEYCLNYESIAHPDDFLIRRTGRLYFDVESVNKYAKIIIEEMANKFNWKNEQIEQYTEELNSLIYDATVIS